MASDKWDGLLDEGTPDEASPRQPREAAPRPRAGVDWTRILLVVLTVALTITVIVWLWNRPASDLSATETPRPVATVSPQPTATQSSPPVQPWSYVEDTTEDPSEGAPQVATQFIHGFCQREVGEDWWSVDTRLEDKATTQVRYEFTEYPDTQTAGIEPGEDVQAIAYTRHDDLPVGQWSATAHITMDTGREITAEIAAGATSDGWRVTNWEVTS